jgi:hypothetical protein
VLRLGGSSSESDEELEGEGSVVGGDERGGGRRRGRSLGAVARRRFLRLWPYLNAAYEGVYFVYQFLYLVERTDWYHLRRISIRTGILKWLRFTYDSEIGSA